MNNLKDSGHSSGGRKWLFIPALLLIMAAALSVKTLYSTPASVYMAGGGGNSLIDQFLCLFKDCIEIEDEYLTVATDEESSTTTGRPPIEGRGSDISTALTSTFTSDQLLINDQPTTEDTQYLTTIHNTHPTTFIQETLPIIETERIITREIITNQANATYNSLDSTINGLTDNLATTFTTSELTVSGDGTITGTLYLASTTPTLTTNRLYNTGDSLYWNGSLVTSSTTGSWTTDGTNVYRTTGNVGIGTTTPSSLLTVEGGDTTLATTTINGELVVNGNTTISNGGELNVGDKIIAPGEIMLGTTSPLAKLTVASTNASQTAFAIYGASGQTSPLLDVFDNSNTSLFRITNTGSVGVGTSSPEALLHLNEVPGSPWLRFSQDGASSRLVDMEFGSALLGASGQTFASYATGGTVNFAWDSANSGTAQMILTGDGNVGIGTTNPGHSLSLAKSSTVTAFGTPYLGIGRGEFTGLNDRYTIGFGYSNTGSAKYPVEIGAQTTNTTDHTKADLVFATRDTTGPSDVPSERMRITAAGNVGIGTTTPENLLHLFSDSGVVSKIEAGTNAYLHIDRGLVDKAAEIYFSTNDTHDWSIGVADSNQLGDGTEFFIGTASGGTSPALVIETNGNVGIGTTTPAGKLDVHGVANFGGSGATFVNAGSGYQTSITGNQDKSTANENALLVLFSADRLADDPLGMFFSVTGDLTGSNRYGTIQMGEYSTGSYRNLALNPSGGNVGIGTTNPLLGLHVGAGSDAIVQNGAAALVSNAGDTTLAVRDATNDVELNIFAYGSASDDSGIIGTFTSHPLVFRTGNTERLRIDTSGNVGIGTTSPGTKLDIRGQTPFRIANTDVDFSSTGTYADMQFGAASGNTYTRLQAFNSGGGAGGVLALNPLGGNVGIGTTSPAYALDVYSATGPKLSLTGGSAQNGMFFDAAGGGDRFYAYSSSLGFGIYNNTDASTSLQIDNNGNVGIGTTNPQARLQLTTASSTGATPLLSIDKDDAAAGTAGIIWNNNGNYGFIDYDSSSSNGIRFSGLGSLRFGYNSNAAYGSSVFTEVMRVTTAGSVGIGDTSPDGSLLLDVEGAIGATTLCDQNGANCAAVTSLTAGSSPWSVSGSDIYYNSGNVGIGSSSPAYPLAVIGETWISNRLHVGNDIYLTNENPVLRANSGDLRFNVDSTEGMRIDSSGNVGIGTTSPVAILDVESDDWRTFRITGKDATNGTRFVLINDGNTSNFGLRVGGTAGADLDEKFAIGTYNPNMTYANPDLLVIDSSGNVGIGTTSPSSLLHLEAGAPVLTLRDSTDDDDFGINFVGNDGTTYYQINGTGDVFNFNSSVGRSFAFQNGNVGIGTTSPTGKLHVSSGAPGISNALSTADELVIESSGNTGLSILTPTANQARISHGTLLDTDSAVIVMDGTSRYMAFETASAERMRINSSGNIGIGTTSASFPLYIGDGGVAINRDSGLDPYLLFRRSGTSMGQIRGDDGRISITSGDGASEYLSVNTSSGNVGIGTTSPEADLHIGNTVAPSGFSPLPLWVATELSVGDGVAFGTPGGKIGLAFFDNAGDQEGNIGVDQTTGDLHIWTNSTNNLVIDDGGAVGIGDNSPDGSLLLDVEGAIGATTLCDQNGANCAAVTSLTAGSSPWSQSGSDIYYNSGSVGIGTTSPTDLLHIHGNSAATRLSNSVSGSGSGDGFQIGLGTGATSAFIWNYENNFMQFGTNNQERMRIDSSGNIGIGTTSPERTLHVYAGNAGSITSNTSADLVVEDDDHAFINLLSPNNRWTGLYLGDQDNNAVAELSINHSSDIMYLTNNFGDITLQPNSGNVGIGTTSPAAKLHVDGDKFILEDDHSAPSTKDNAQLVIRGDTDTNQQLLVGYNTIENYGFVQAAQWGVNWMDLILNQKGGNVGIGTTSPASKLDVWGDLRVGTSSIPTLFTDVSNERVGIGTASPTGQLHLYTTGTGNDTGQIRVEAADDPNVTLVNSGTQAWTINIDSSDSDKFQIGPSNSGVSSMSDYLTINTSGNVGIGQPTPTQKLSIYENTTNAGNSAGVMIQQDGTGDASLSFLLTGAYEWLAGIDNSDDDKFKIADATGTGDYTNTRLTIDSSGNVGIGTTSPATTLTVSNSSVAPASGASSWDSNGAQLTIDSLAASATDGGSALAFRSKLASGNMGGFAVIKGGIEAANNNNGYLSFLTRTNSVHATERMRITSTGNVGIGTTSPDTKLHIEGSGAAITSQIENTQTDGNTWLGLKNDAQQWQVGLRGDQNDNFNIWQTGAGARVVVDTNGNVGIGTTSPNESLNITRSSGPTMALNTTNDTGYLRFVSVGSENWIQSGLLASNGSAAPLHFSDIFGSNKWMTIGSTGKVGIGTSSPGAVLDIVNDGILGLRVQGTSGNAALRVENTSTDGDFLDIQPGIHGVDFDVNDALTLTLEDDGHLLPGSDNTQNLGSPSLHWSCLYYDATNLGTCSSDERLKENIADLTFSTSTIHQLVNLKPRTFEWKANPGTTNYGLIAQEVLETSPDLVVEGEDGLLKVRYGHLIYLVITGIQEMWEIVTGNHEEIAELREENTNIKAELEEIKEALDLRSDEKFDKDEPNNGGSSGSGNDDPEDNNDTEDTATSSDDVLETVDDLEDDEEETKETDNSDSKEEDQETIEDETTEAEEDEEGETTADEPELVEEEDSESEEESVEGETATLEQT